jgi:4-amino-4-deoxy-L-arabinose transferase-like glycosyltransferase
MLFEGFHQRSERVLLGIILFLILPALFLFLGKPLLIEDEAIRALVAYEMQMQDDYITPTIGGDLYFKKPPLYNWILSAFTQLLDDYSMLSLRIPNVIFLISFAASVWYFVRRELGNRVGVMVALAFLTSGRILYYESFLALIDILFSWMVFLEFICIYHFFKKRNFLALFLSVYVLTIIAFMLKTLPALVFTALSLLVYFAYKREVKKLFSWQHILSIAMFFGVVGAYYFVYFQRNDIGFVELFSVMFTESSQRTAVGGNLLPMLKHILTYPFEIIAHFVPWTLLVFLLFKKRNIQEIKKQPFVLFASIMFIVNILLYWVSPEIYPRYILMLIPLLFIPLIYLFEHQLYLRNKMVIFLSVVLVALIVRIGVNIFVFPLRANEPVNLSHKTLAVDLAQKYGDERIYSYYPEGLDTDYYGRRLATYDFMYYLSIEKAQMFKITSEVQTGELYMVASTHWNPVLFTPIDTVDAVPNYSYYHYIARGK